MEDHFKVTSKNGRYSINFDGNDHSGGTINGKKFDLDIVETATGFHIIEDNKTYRVTVVRTDPDNRTVELKINSFFYSFTVRDRYDELLEKLGMDKLAAGKVSDIRAPMPGLVLDVMVKTGDAVEADQSLIILEAMKMENVIRSPGEGIVRSVTVKKGDSVEKNQILLEFEI